MKEFNTNLKKQNAQNPRVLIIKAQNNIITIAFIVFAIITVCFGFARFNGKAIGYTEQDIEQLIRENEDNPQSVKYLVTDNCISRV